MEIKYPSKTIQSTKITQNDITSKTEISSEKDRIKLNRNRSFQNLKYLNYIPPKHLEQDNVEEEKDDEPVTEMKFDSNNSSSNNNSKIENVNRLITLNSIIKHEEYVNKCKEVRTPHTRIKEQIDRLEKKLFSLMNIDYGKEIIYEDFVLVNNNQDYYLHLLRTANLDPNKENFLLIHGFLSSSTHFLSVLPYLLSKYNVFIPDTIGMGLSSRPQIDFNSPEECENYFIEIIYILVKKYFFHIIIILKMIFILEDIHLVALWLVII